MKIFKHLKSDWFKYGFETLAIVVGILAAFALENWNEERQSETQAAHFLQYIASDIDADLQELQTLLEHVDTSIYRARSLINSFKQRSFDLQNASIHIAWLNVEKSFRANRSEQRRNLSLRALC